MRREPGPQAIYINTNNRKRTDMFTKPATPEKSPAPPAASSAEYVPLTVVAAELHELGLGDADALAKHVGPERLVLVAGLVRCVPAELVRELADDLGALRARKAVAAERAAEQARILERKEFDAAVAERVHREKVQRIIDNLGCSYVVACEVLAGERDETGHRLADADRTGELLSGVMIYRQIQQR